MGLNQAKVCNKTGQELYILVFSNVELLYWSYRDLRGVPESGEEIVVDGLVGGNALKVGVIYKQTEGLFVYDLFRLTHGATLCLRSITRSGVKVFDDVQGVSLLRRSKTIRIGHNQEQGVVSGIKMANGVAGLAGRVSGLL